MNCRSCKNEAEENGQYCADCADADKYICRLCASVHSDASPCDAQLRRIESAERS